MIINFLAGLGLFLFGMHLLEGALKKLSGATFRNVLRRYTQNRFRALSSGSLVTALLQSSTATSLIVLAFVGAGILHLQNAIGVIIGANLGTSITSWIVAGVGFNIDIQVIARPLLAIGALGLIILGTRKKLNATFSLMVGFGLLFTGLDFMKESTSHIAEEVDPEILQGYSIIVYFLAGALLSGLLQSSSASIAIVMSALFAGLLTFHQSAAVVIGTTIGTTITIILASLGNQVNKMRLAFAHLIFNTISSIIGLMLLFPLSFFILEFLGFSEYPIVGLAIFHSLFILLGIILQLPFISTLTRFITWLIPKRDQSITRFIHHDQLNVPEVALEAIEQEISRLLLMTIFFNSRLLNISPPPQSRTSDGFSQNLEDFYDNIKNLHGEIVYFISRMQNQELNQQVVATLNQYLSAVNDATKSAKYLKDITHNLEQFSGADYEFLYKTFPATLKEFYEKELIHLTEMLEEADKENAFKLLWEAKNRQGNFEDELNSLINEALKQKDFPSYHISSLNHAKNNILLSGEALLNAYQNLLLPEREKELFTAIAE